ncbi:hypothetical protein PIB30_031279 [Stylosanthes scabra]|uniref:Uncharacterized protein n=1 Tax=Stylosanthes scabra TaxID=79078 RepID=A0ABU6Y911_9FABA|nr:hypothetical protein [Stylosanthes scabra]
MGISWIMSWDYDSAAFEDSPSIQYLIRVIKIKWWSKYDFNILRKAAIDQWLSTSQKHPAITSSSINMTNKISYEKESQFLAQKKQILAALAAATSEEDIHNSLQAIQAMPLGEDEEVQSSPTQYFQDSQDPYEMAEHGYRVPDYPSGLELNQLYWFSTRETAPSPPTASLHRPSPQATTPTLPPSPSPDIADVEGVTPARLTSPPVVIVASRHLAVARPLSLDSLALSPSRAHWSRRCTSGEAHRRTQPTWRLRSAVLSSHSPPTRVEISRSRLLTAHFDIAFGYSRSPRPVAVIPRQRRRRARPLCRE